MRRRPVASAAAAACGVLILASVMATPRAPKGSEKEAPAEDIFGLTKVWAVHLEIPATEYEAMQPVGGMGFPGGPGKPPPPPPPKPRDGRPSERNALGVEFPWAQGELTADGKTYRKVGVRYAGDGSYTASARGLKRPLKVELSRSEDQHFRGMRTLHLDAGTLDPSKGREALAYAVFRAAGVPAPRTAFAEVTLTVPGKYDKEYLGLYTLVEPVDRTFLADRFQTDKALLMRPERLRGLDHLGDDWERYKTSYRPQSEATMEQAQRVIDFTRLVNRGSDEEFRKEIGSYLDVDQFLRFLAVNAVIANVESFFTMGRNYALCLHPKSNKFVFIPTDLEMSLGYYSMMASAEQLMDLSLTRPYAAPNRLADRLLAVKEVGERYQQVLKELTATAFRRERLLGDIDVIEKTTNEPLAKERKAAAARKEGAVTFGQGGATFGRPPELRTFVERRLDSAAAQLDGKSKGYVPSSGFGPGFGPPGGAGAATLSDKTIRDIVPAPADFDVTLFAAPPQVTYPVALSAAPNGDVYVAVDEQGSLGRSPGGGRVVRCVDKDGDGKADQVNVFARMEHPRGVVALGASVWVLHPPLLSVFHDDDGDGVADRQDVLVTGLTTEVIATRGGDHTTNGIRMGVDGWVYIAVGDYGFRGARGKDGTTLSQRGGGILRVRPDGTEMEVFATGLRNPFELAIDPYLNLFARDNTNDGAGWDVRVSHLVPTGQYGYTQLYAHFADEIMPPLGQFGGGGTAGLFLQDDRWPEKYRNTLYTGDWGRSEVYRHALRPNGATFELQQEVFLKFPRPTGMDLDGSGRLYVCSWRGGEASVYVGPRVGFVARVAPRDLKPTPPPDLKKASSTQLIADFTGPNAAARLHSQRELLRRGRSAETTRALTLLASYDAAPLHGRVAAIFTLKQLDGKDAQAPLVKLAEDAAVREFALRALTDRKGELEGLDAKPFRAALADASPRVRAQALVSLGRLNDVAAAKAILPLTARPKGSALPAGKPLHAQPDPDRVLPHLAVRALVSLQAVDACLEALDGPHRDGALAALRTLHDKSVVDGLIRKLGTAWSVELRRGILTALIRLYHREAEYDGSWWGIRPDSTGPYYDRQEWDLSPRIASVIANAYRDGDAATVAFLRTELVRHQVYVPGLPLTPAAAARQDEAQAAIVIPKADPKNPDQVGNMPYEAAAKRALQARGDARKGKALFDSQSCRACHTDADGQAPKGPHLVDIGKRYKPDELVESILKPSAKLAQGFETYTFVMADGRQFTGFVVSEGAGTVSIRELTGVPRELKRGAIEARHRQEASSMPEGMAGNLTPEQLADLIAYLRLLE